MDNKIGFYLVLEGVDFTGKTTIAKKLVEKLNELYGAENVMHRREPSYDNYGAKMRETLFSGEMTPEKEILAAQYMLLDRIENTSKVSDLLRQNKIVIQERNFLTALAYNEAKETKEVQFVQEANKLSLKPDYLVLITASDSVIKYRIEKAAECRGAVDDYESWDKVSVRKKAYFQLGEYVSEVLVNDNSDSMEKILERLLKVVDDNYYLLLNQSAPDTNYRGINL